MKKKKLKKLSLRKLEIAKIDFSERIKGGSAHADLLVCANGSLRGCNGGIG